MPRVQFPLLPPPWMLGLVGYGQQVRGDGWWVGWLAWVAWGWGVLWCRRGAVPLRRGSSFPCLCGRLCGCGGRVLRSRQGGGGFPSAAAPAAVVLVLVGEGRQARGDG